MTAMSDQQETGVIAIATSPLSPIASSSSYLPPDIATAKSGPGVTRAPPVLYLHTFEDPGMRQNTVPVTPYYHAPLSISDSKSGPGVLQQHGAPPNMFQQQTVPVEEEFQSIPQLRISDIKSGPGVPQENNAPSHFLQQQTVPVEEEFDSVPIPQPYQIPDAKSALGGPQQHNAPSSFFQQQTVPIIEEFQTVPVPQPYQQQTVPTPEEYEQQTVPQYDEQQPPIPEQYPRRPPPSHPASSSSTLSSPSSIEKPPFIFNYDFDENGFTAEERREHERTMKRLQALRWVMFSRWFIRIVSVIVSLISFTLIMITVVLFLRSRHSQKPQVLQDARGQYDTVDIKPSAAFASIGGIFTIISLAVNIGCCFSKKVRQITPLSNAIFATISVVGISSWLSGCFYLHRNSAGRNLWYYVCAAAQQYHYAESHEHSENPASRMLMLLRRGDDNLDSRGLNFLAMCQYTQRSWDLGIAVACFEILTLLNVIVAIVILKWAWIRIWMKGQW